MFYQAKIIKLVIQ